MHFFLVFFFILLGSNNDKQTVIYELIDHCTLHNSKIFKFSFLVLCRMIHLQNGERKERQKPIKTKSH